MMKWLALLSVCLVLLTGSTSFAEEKLTCKDDPRECFEGFKPDGTVVTRDGEAEKTFAFPAMKAGFLVDIYGRDILPHVSLEVLEFEALWGQDFALDLGVASSRVFTSLSWELIPLVKAGPSIWVGYNVKENTQAFGLGFTVLDF